MTALRAKLGGRGKLGSAVGTDRGQVRTALPAVLRPGAIFVPAFRTLHEKSKGQLEAARFLSVAAHASSSKALRQLSGLVTYI